MRVYWRDVRCWTLDGLPALNVAIGGFLVGATLTNNLLAAVAAGLGFYLAYRLARTKAIGDGERAEMRALWRDLYRITHKHQHGDTLVLSDGSEVFNVFRRRGCGLERITTAEIDWPQGDQQNGVVPYTLFVLTGVTSGFVQQSVYPVLRGEDGVLRLDPLRKRRRLSLIEEWKVDRLASRLGTLEVAELREAVQQAREAMPVR